MLILLAIVYSAIVALLVSPDEQYQCRPSALKWLPHCARALNLPGAGLIYQAWGMLIVGGWLALFFLPADFALAVEWTGGLVLTAIFGHCLWMLRHDAYNPNGAVVPRDFDEAVILIADDVDIRAMGVGSALARKSMTDIGLDGLRLISQDWRPVSLPDGAEMIPIPNALHAALIDLFLCTSETQRHQAKTIVDLELRLDELRAENLRMETELETAQNSIAKLQSALSQAKESSRSVLGRQFASPDLEIQALEARLATVRSSNSSGGASSMQTKLI